MNLKEAEKYRDVMLARGHKSDGCTLAPEIGAKCCKMHDLLRRIQPDGMTAAQADKLLFQCMWSRGGFVALMAPVYWLGVRIGALVFK